MKPDQSRLTTLLTDTVILLCKNGLNFQGTLRIEGVLGITIDDNDVFIVHLNENVSNTVETSNLCGISQDHETQEEATDANLDRHISVTPERQAVPLTYRSRKTPEKTTVVHETKVETKLATASTENSLSSEAQSKATPAARNASESQFEPAVCIKEEEDSDDHNVIFTENTGAAPYNHNEGQMMDVAEHDSDEQSFKWNKMARHSSRSLRNVKYAGTSGESFTRRDVRATGHGSWDLDALALSSLSEVTNGEVNPWPGYVWNGSSYVMDCVPTEPKRGHSQSMYPTDSCASETRSHQDDLSQHNAELGGIAAFKPFACPVVGCNRRFYHRNNVYRHRKQKHGGNIMGVGSISKKFNM